MCKHFPSVFIVLVVVAAGRVLANPEKSQLVVSEIQYGQPREISMLDYKRIKESSGLAASLSRRGVFWTHNDSGNKPLLYAFDMKGKNLGEYELAGVKADDWEDMASFKLAGRGYLLVGDIGDNDGERKVCQLHFVEEPHDSDKKVLRPFRSYFFRFEDGPRDCEALGVDLRSRQILLVTKRAIPRANVYAISWPKKSQTETLVAKRIATLPLSMVTAMDVSDDGLRAVVLTYLIAKQYVRSPDESWAKAFSRRGQEIPMPVRRQGETICYGHDGFSLYLTSEKRPTPLFVVPAIVEKVK